MWSGGEAHCIFLNNTRLLSPQLGQVVSIRQGLYIAICVPNVWNPGDACAMDASQINNLNKMGIMGFASV